MIPNRDPFGLGVRMNNTRFRAMQAGPPYDMSGDRFDRSSVLGTSGRMMHPGVTEDPNFDPSILLQLLPAATKSNQHSHLDQLRQRFIQMAMAGRGA